MRLQPPSSSFAMDKPWWWLVEDVVVICDGRARVVVDLVVVSRSVHVV